MTDSISDYLHEARMEMIEGFEKQLEELEERYPGIVKILAEQGWYVNNDFSQDENGKWIMSMQLKKPWVECDDEINSWDVFTPNQIDYYWLQCNLEQDHEGLHKNSETGGTWQ